MSSVVNCAIDPCTISLYMILNFVEDVHVSNGAIEYIFFEEKCLLSTVVAV